MNSFSFGSNNPHKPWKLAVRNAKRKALSLWFSHTFTFGDVARQAPAGDTSSNA